MKDPYRPGFPTQSFWLPQSILFTKEILYKIPMKMGDYKWKKLAWSSISAMMINIPIGSIGRFTYYFCGLVFMVTNHKYWEDDPSRSTKYNKQSAKRPLEDLAIQALPQGATRFTRRDFNVGIFHRWKGHCRFWSDINDAQKTPTLDIKHLKMAL